MFGWMDTHPELQVTGFIAHNPEAVHRAIEAGVDDSYFETPLGKAMWESIAKTHTEGKPVTFATIGCGIPTSLRVEFADASLSFPMETNFEYHLEELANHVARTKAKQAAEFGNDALEKARIVHHTVEQVMGGLKPQASLRDQVEAWTHHKESFLSGKKTGASSHIKALNEAMPRGFSAGGMFVLAARPGTGKTTLALNFASHVSQTDRVVFATLEMPEVEIIDRLIALRSRVPFGAKILSEDQNDRMMAAARKLATETPLDIWDDWQGRWDILEAKLNRVVKERKPPKLVVIDHLAIMKFDSKTRDSVTNLSEITGAIKRFAITNQVAILLCSQMNRTIEQDGGRSPRLSDLRGSGTIEQDADVVMFIHQDSKSERYHLLVAKNRHGKAHMMFPLATNFAISEMKGDEI